MKLTITSVVQGVAQEYAFEGTQEEILSSVFRMGLAEEFVRETSNPWLIPHPVDSIALCGGANKDLDQEVVDKIKKALAYNFRPTGVSI